MAQKARPAARSKVAARRAAEPGSPLRVSVLGATGSVGRSTLDLIAQTPDRFRVVALTANGNYAALAELAVRHRAEVAVVADEECAVHLRQLLVGTGIASAAGEAAVIEAASRPADCIVAAIVGSAGLPPTLAAVRQGTRLALANKECLVSAGPVFMEAVRAARTTLLPVDSEHSGLLQALAGSDPSEVERLVLTASGGPFRIWTREQIAAARPADALKHPNWSMGQKITIDSASLMNKGLELIEAHHLFGVRPDQLGVVVHPQSIVHALVEHRDGSVIAQLANPDMRTPIAVSLAWPGRMAAPTARLDLVALGALTFEAPDLDRFPALAVAQAALARGPRACAVLNAANEVAVAVFLEGRLGFLDIAKLVADTLDAAEREGGGQALDSLEAVLDCDLSARRTAWELVERRGR